MAVRPGIRVGPYEIVASIGAGGMGEVYRARDTRLGRDVAIKVLPAEFASDPDRLRRFEQEARAIAALSHPNILAIHDVGTHGAIPYLVTELLEGDSLRDRLRSGGLTVRKAVEMAVQIAQGLAVAHEKGIIHRDLKPANIFVTKDGQVKILDFGLAKLTQPEAPHDPFAKTVSGEPSTESGAVLGTMGYTSPEQLRGEKADARSDIFSFGCVLYEMLSGTSPFLKRTGAETVTAIMREDPAPLAGTGRAVAPALQEIVSRCLEKRPEDRFTSAHDLALALRATSGGSEGPVTARARARLLRIRRPWLVGAASLALLAVVVGVLVLKLKPANPSSRAAAPPKIVVLPFENLGSAEDAYFASGMAEEITSRLANVQGLGVISRTSALQYEHTRKTVKQIGVELGVDFVLEGTVRWEHGPGQESRVRITPQLIRVADDTHVWAARYDRVLADVFAIQSDVAESAVRAMDVALLPRERRALTTTSTNDLEAYDFYLRGRDSLGSGEDRTHVEGAAQMFRAAVARDPRFAQAFAGLARAELFMYWNYFDRSMERVAKAKDAAERAVELQPDLAETHTALGYYFYRSSRDYKRALDEFSTALSIQPSDSAAREGISYVLRRQGRWRDSADEITRALAFDPRNAVFVYNLARSCVLARRYAEAQRALRLAISLSPGWAEPYTAIAHEELAWRGDADKAQAALDEAGRVPELTDHSHGLTLAQLRVALVRRDYEAALQALDTGKLDVINDTFEYSPAELLRGEVLMSAGRLDRARGSFQEARRKLEARIREDADDARGRSSLAIAYAGLGRQDDAVQEARLGCELMSATTDAWLALHRLNDLAAVYTMVGRTGDAIATLDALLGRSGWYTANTLRLEPVWDPLRSDPRFQALLTKYEVKP